MLDKLKQNNIKNIMLSLLSGGAKTKMELGPLTGLSNASISDCINKMLSCKIVEKVGYEKSIGGRRSVIYNINQHYGSFIGLTVTGGMIHIAITNCQGRLVQCFSLDEGTETVSILDIYASIEHALYNLNGKPVLAIGIGINGIIDYDNQIVIKSDSPNWSDVHLKELIERRYMVPTFLDHPVNSVALTEKIMGAGKRQNSFLWVPEKQDTASSDFEKWGIYLDGKIARGLNNTAGYASLGRKDGVLQYDIIQKLAAFTGAECIIIGTENPEEISAVESIQFPVVTKTKLNKHSYAEASAISAEIEWFQSIYFMLQSE